MNLFKHTRRIRFGDYLRGSVRFSSGEPSPNPNRKRKSSYVSIAQQIYSHLKDSHTFVANHDRITPGLFRRRSVAPACWYCFSDSTAETLFQAMKGRLSPGKYIIENTPGLGLITKKLLSVGPARLYAFEPDSNFRDILSPLTASHPELTIVPKQFLALWKEGFKEKVYGDERLSELLPHLDHSDWESDPNVQIFSTDPSRKFVEYMINCVTFQHGIINYGKPELFFVTTPEILVQMTYDRSSPFVALRLKKFSRLLLFSIYFDIELLGEVDYKSFVPWFRKRNLKPKDEEFYRLVFVHAVPKRDLHKVLPHKLLNPLWFFVNQAVCKPHDKFIPFFEKWIPGCGPLFIAKGLSVFTEFRDLAPSELLDVFLTFANHPDFETSLFKEAVDSFAFKVASDAVHDDHIQVDIVDKNATKPQ